MVGIGDDHGGASNGAIFGMAGADRGLRRRRGQELRGEFLRDAQMAIRHRVRGRDYQRRRGMMARTERLSAARRSWTVAKASPSLSSAAWIPERTKTASMPWRTAPAMSVLRPSPMAMTSLRSTA